MVEPLPLGTAVGTGIGGGLLVTSPSGVQEQFQSTPTGPRVIVTRNIRGLRRGEGPRQRPVEDKPIQGPQQPTFTPTPQPFTPAPRSEFAQDFTTVAQRREAIREEVVRGRVEEFQRLSPEEISRRARSGEEGFTGLSTPQGEQIFFDVGDISADVKARERQLAKQSPREERALFGRSIVEGAKESQTRSFLEDIRGSERARRKEGIGFIEGTEFRRGFIQERREERARQKDIFQAVGGAFNPQDIAVTSALAGSAASIGKFEPTAQRGLLRALEQEPFETVAITTRAKGPTGGREIEAFSVRGVEAETIGGRQLRAAQTAQFRVNELPKGQFIATRGRLTTATEGFETTFQAKDIFGGTGVTILGKGPREVGGFRLDEAVTLGVRKQPGTRADPFIEFSEIARKPGARVSRIVDVQPQKGGIGIDPFGRGTEVFGRVRGRTTFIDSAQPSLRPGDSAFSIGRGKGATTPFQIQEQTLDSAFTSIVPKQVSRPVTTQARPPILSGGGAEAIFRAQPSVIQQAPQAETILQPPRGQTAITQTSFQQLGLAQPQKVTPAPRARVSPGTAIIPRISTDIITSQRTELAQITIPRTTVTTDDFLAPPTGRFGFDFGPSFTRIPFAGLPSLGGGTRKRKRVTKGRRLRRTPSFAAATLGITAESPVTGEITGLIERPIIKRRRRKKR